MYSVGGRPKHVSALRAEFDKGGLNPLLELHHCANSLIVGADYDLASCEPGDLDPHAVASVFKAFFRECELIAYLGASCC